MFLVRLGIELGTIARCQNQWPGYRGTDIWYSERFHLCPHGDTGHYPRHCRPCQNRKERRQINRHGLCYRRDCGSRVIIILGLGDFDAGFEQSEEPGAEFGLPGESQEFYTCGDDVRAGP